MELAIAIQAIEDLSFFDQPWMATDHSLMEQEIMEEVRTSLSEQFGKQFGKGSPQRLYFGSEFCQYRLPKEKDLLRAYDFAQENQLAFTLVTPYLPQAGLNKLKALLASLAQDLEGESGQNVEQRAEVVVNDWGTLYYLQQEYPQFDLVLGRLLNKMIRDPRVTHLYDQEEAPTSAKQALQESANSVSYFREFVGNAGVTRIELDNMIQGLHVSEEEWLPASLHLGYGCVATGRSCLVGTLHQPKESKFKGDVVCKQQCRHYQAELVNANEGFGSVATRMIQKGNSVFFIQDKDLLQQGLSWVSRHAVNRLVYSPRIPV